MVEYIINANPKRKKAMDSLKSAIKKQTIETNPKRYFI